MDDEEAETFMDIMNLSTGVKKPNNTVTGPRWVRRLDNAQVGGLRVLLTKTGAKKLSESIVELKVISHAAEDGQLAKER